MRILGLDYGSKTVGAAVTDPLMVTVRGIEIIRRPKENHLRGTMRRIGELIGQYEPEAIVLGLPLNMDGTEGERARLTREFGEGLRTRFRLPVFYCDERLTTVEAEEIMEENGLKRADYKKYVDGIAAAVILKDWLNAHGDDYTHS